MLFYNNNKKEREKLWTGKEEEEDKIKKRVHNKFNNVLLLVDLDY